MLQEVRSKIVWKKFGKFVKGKKEVMEQDTDINIQIWKGGDGGAEKKVSL